LATLISYTEAEMIGDNTNKKLSCRRECATFRVVDYFTESLKIIRNDTVEYGVCKSTLVFH